MAKYDIEAAKLEGKRAAKMEGLRSKGYSEIDALKMVSMKKEPKKEEKDKSDSPATCSPMDEPFPYGLRIRLENDELSKLGMDELPEVGKTCKIEAEGVVQSVSSNQYKNDAENRRSVEIQLTKLGVSKAEIVADEDEEA
ncbi:MAG: capsid staple protein [Candidatus Altimarinota bacterium]